MQSDTAELHRRACSQVTTRVECIAANLVSGTSWVAPLVEGSTIAEVGGRFDGDLLGAESGRKVV